MDFFDEWILSRIHETGWPKSEGIFKKKLVISEGAITNSMQDAVRIALALGSGMPEAAISIAISEALQTPSQRQVSYEISAAAELGSKKLNYQPGLNPIWLHFCLSEFQNNMGDIKLVFWNVSDDRAVHDMSDPSVSKMIETARRNALIAMCWAIRNPEDTVRLFYPGKPLVSKALEMVKAKDIFDGWLDMAKMSVSLYESIFGRQNLEDLRER